MSNRWWSAQWSRRSMLAGLGASFSTMLSHSSLLAADSTVKKPTTNRTDFYDANGIFLVEKARDAYFEMLRAIHYPVTQLEKQKVCIADFGLGLFTILVMGVIICVNRLD